uniref:Acyl-CoA_dh_1 domain-containing protein n=1 Tax=Macrostomum lignano TaxID=282301 RepID=A0A1I8JPM2_9PLAT
MTRARGRSDLQGVQDAAMNPRRRLTFSMAIKPSSLTAGTSPPAGISLLPGGNSEYAGFRKGRKLDKMGLKAAGHAELFFEECALPASALLRPVRTAACYLIERAAQGAVLLSADMARPALSGCSRRLAATSANDAAFGRTLLGFADLLAALKTAFGLIVPRELLPVVSKRYDRYCIKVSASGLAAYSAFDACAIDAKKDDELRIKFNQFFSRAFLLASALLPPATAAAAAAAGRRRQLLTPWWCRKSIRYDLAIQANSADSASSRQAAAVAKRLPPPRRFASPLTIQHKLADLKTEICVARAFADQCIELQNEGRLDSFTASMAKLWCTEMQNRVAYDCVQLHGGWATYLPNQNLPALQSAESLSTGKRVPQSLPSQRGRHLAFQVEHAVKRVEVARACSRPAADSTAELQNFGAAHRAGAGERQRQDVAPLQVVDSIGVGIACGAPVSRKMMARSCSSSAWRRSRQAQALRQHTGVPANRRAPGGSAASCRRVQAEAGAEVQPASVGLRVPGHLLIAKLEYRTHYGQRTPHLQDDDIQPVLLQQGHPIIQDAIKSRAVALPSATSAPRCLWTSARSCLGRPDRRGPAAQIDLHRLQVRGVVRVSCLRLRLVSDRLVGREFPARWLLAAGVDGSLVEVAAVVAELRPQEFGSVPDPDSESCSRRLKKDLQAWCRSRHRSDLPAGNGGHCTTEQRCPRLVIALCWLADLKRFLEALFEAVGFARPPIKSARLTAQHHFMAGSSQTGRDGYRLLTGPAASGRHRAALLRQNLRASGAACSLEGASFSRPVMAADCLQSGARMSVTTSGWQLEQHDLTLTVIWRLRFGDEGAGRADPSLPGPASAACDSKRGTRPRIHDSLHGPSGTRRAGAALISDQTLVSPVPTAKWQTGRPPGT